MKNYKSGEQFVNFLYNNLINSKEVKNSIKRSDKKVRNKEEMVSIYFDRLERTHSRKLKLLKSYYYDRYLIKEVPNDYV